MHLLPNIEQLLDGLVAAALYLLVALGLSLIFRLGGIVNLGHGPFYAIAAYLAVELSGALGFAGSMALAAALVGVLGIGIERMLFRGFYGADPARALIVTFALVMVAQESLRATFGSAPIAVETPPDPGGEIRLLGMRYSTYRWMILAVAALAVGSISLLIHRTPFGRVVRAGMQDPEVVGALGISLTPYMTALAALGAVLAALAGVLSAPIASVHPAMGWEILVAAACVAVIGGLGSIRGLVAAALLVGVVRGLASHLVAPAGDAAM